MPHLMTSSQRSLAPTVPPPYTSRSRLNLLFQTTIFNALIWDRPYIGPPLRAKYIYTRAGIRAEEGAEGGGGGGTASWMHSLVH
jgi:hypothetical protein